MLTNAKHAVIIKREVIKMSLAYKFICKGPNIITEKGVIGAKCRLCDTVVSTSEDSCSCGNVTNDKAVARFSAKHGKGSIEYIHKSYKAWGGFPITHAKCPICEKYIKIDGENGCACGNIIIDKHSGRFSVKGDEGQIELYAKRTPGYFIYKAVCFFENIFDYFI